MKKILLGIAVLLTYLNASAQKKISDTSFLEPVEVSSIRATDKTPVAKTTLSKKEIQDNNIGQDLPFILNQTPSVIVNSDAGNGIGYTGIRIRGSDASRINITLNGIPYNDAESQGTYFVDLPDIASSAASIQVQRGVGTSTNGAGAFAGSINISTNDLNKKPSFQFNNSAGSYESFKNTLIYSSGIFKKHLVIDARLSDIRSEGYIDRASTRLKSMYGSIAYVNDKNSIRFNLISGKEKTYQAWNGIDEQTLRTNRRFNSAGTERPVVPYDNETDNYVQTHYQLFYNHKFNERWKGNLATFLTRGKGYYEQYKADQSLSAYGLPDFISGTDTARSTDLVRRLWLDNYFYGAIFSGQFESRKRQIIIGGGVNEYKGDHYGEIHSAILQQAVPESFRYYDNNASKKEGSTYAKWTEKLNKNWQTFLDLQVRIVDYSINGFEDNPALLVKNDYAFFNPKTGVTYSNGNMKAYFSFSHASKEPNRDDFEAGTRHQPKPEKLNDFEAGIERKHKAASYGVNFFYMQYKDQLVLTGKINDVGAYTRTNIPGSYRVGLEAEGSAIFSRYFSAAGNLSLSRNKIKGFTEFIDNYDNGSQETNFYKDPDIAFSPAVVASVSLAFFPVEHAEIDLISKFVGKQYLDNTQHADRSLGGYYNQDGRASYSFKQSSSTTMKVFVQVNNIFSRKYEPNGYTYSYISGGSLATENYYFPMAPVNFMAGLNISL